MRGKSTRNVKLRARREKEDRKGNALYLQAVPTSFHLNIYHLWAAGHHIKGTKAPPPACDGGKCGRSGGMPDMPACEHDGHRHPDFQGKLETVPKAESHSRARLTAPVASETAPSAAVFHHSCFLEKLQFFPKAATILSASNAGEKLSDYADLAASPENVISFLHMDFPYGRLEQPQGPPVRPPKEGAERKAALVSVVPAQAGLVLTGLMGSFLQRWDNSPVCPSGSVTWKERQAFANSLSLWSLNQRWIFQEASDLGLLPASFAIPDLVFVFLKSPDII